MQLLSLVQFICLKTKRGQQQSQAAACDQSPRFLLVYLLHISENDSFPSAIYTAVIISIVMRETAACLQLFITYRNKVWFWFFFYCKMFVVIVTIGTFIM